VQKGREDEGGALLAEGFGRGEGQSGKGHARAGGRLGCRAGGTQEGETQLRGHRAQRDRLLVHGHLRLAPLRPGPWRLPQECLQLRQGRKGGTGERRSQQERKANRQAARAARGRGWL